MPFQSCSTIWNVDTDQKKLVILQRNSASLPIVLWGSDVVSDVKRFYLGKNNCARVTPDGRLAAVPVLVVFSWKLIFESLRYHSFLVNFGFLDAQNRWIRFLKKLLKSVLFYYSTNSVDIPRPNLNI